MKINFGHFPWAFWFQRSSSPFAALSSRTHARVVSVARWRGRSQPCARPTGDCIPLDIRKRAPEKSACLTLVEAFVGTLQSTFYPTRIYLPCSFRWLSCGCVASPRFLVFASSWMVRSDKMWQNRKLNFQKCRKCVRLVIFPWDCDIMWQIVRSSRLFLL